MKKTYRILLAGFAALAVFSCNKDVKPAAPMSCEEVQKKLQKIREDAAQICEDAAKVHEANAVQSGE